MTPNPFLTIWTRPRATIQGIVSQDPTRRVSLLVCLFGIGEALSRASMRNLGDRLPLWLILLMALLLGPLGGLFTLWLYSHLVRWTGSWLGGAGNREHIKAALAWGVVPLAFAVALWIPDLLFFGAECFTKEMPRLEAQPLLLIPYAVSCVAGIVLYVWSFVLLSHTVAEVQGFRSAWRGFGNLCLAVAAVVVPVLVLALLIAGFVAVIR